MNLINGKERKMLKDVVKYLHPAISKWIMANVTFIENNSIPTMGVGVKNNVGIFLEYNPEFYDKLNDEEKRFLWVHEISHIIRGDVFKKFENYEEIDARLWNITWDAIINQHFNQKDIDLVKKLGGIVYEDLRNEFPNLPSMLSLVSEYEIYRTLKDYQQESHDALKKLLDGMANNKFGEVKPASEQLDSETKIKTLIDVMNLQAQIKSDPETFKEYFGHFASPGTYSKKENYAINKPVEIPIIEKIMSICKKAGNKFKKQRSYRREGLLEGLRGLTRKRIGKVFLGLDVSGSVYSHISLFLGVASYLTFKKFIVEFGTFSSEFHVYPNLPRREVEIQGAGGGTEIKEMMDYLKGKDYDLAIIATDGEIFDWSVDLTEQLSFPVVWLMTENNRMQVAKKDFVINLWEAIKK